MGVFSNKISKDELKPGNHIYTWRSYIYSHHGIYVGDGKVIHFTRKGGIEVGSKTFLDEISSYSNPNHEGHNPCINCGDQRYLCGVISSCLDCFLKGGKLYLYKYNVSKATFLAKQRGGTCTMTPSDPSDDEVVDRAKKLLSTNGFGDYHLFGRNCEDFAIYCKTSTIVLSDTKLGGSSQVNSVCAAGRAASKHVRSLAIGCAVGGLSGMALVGYRHYCISRVNTDIGVREGAVKVPVEELPTFKAAMEGELDNNK